MHNRGFIVAVLMALISVQSAHAQVALSEQGQEEAPSLTPSEERAVPSCQGDEIEAAAAFAKQGKELFKLAVRTTPVDLNLAEAALRAFNQQCAAGSDWALEQRAAVLVVLKRDLEAARSLDAFLARHPLESLPADVRVRVEKNTPLVYAHVGTLEIATNVLEGALAALDGGPMLPIDGRPLRAQPGHHVVRIEAPNFVAVESEVELVEGLSTPLTVTLSRVVTAAPPIATGMGSASERPRAQRRSLRPWAFAAAGTAGAFMALGVTGAVKAFNAVDEYRSLGCANDASQAGCASAERSYEVGLNLEVVGLAMGGGFAATSALLFFMHSKRARLERRPVNARASMVPTRGGLGLFCVGQF